MAGVIEYLLDQKDWLLLKIAAKHYLTYNIYNITASEKIWLLCTLAYTYVKLGYEDCENGRKNIESTFLRCINIEPDNGLLYANLAFHYARTGRIDKAKDRFRIACEMAIDQNIKRQLWKMLVFLSNSSPRGKIMASLRPCLKSCFVA